MHIILTDDRSGMQVSVEATTVLLTRRDPENKLISHVITGIVNPSTGQFQALAVREGPMEIARRVNAAKRIELSKCEIDYPENVLGFENN